MIMEINGVVKSLEKLDEKEPPKKTLGKLFKKPSCDTEPYILEIVQDNKTLTTIFMGDEEELPTAGSKVTGIAHIVEGLPNDKGLNVELTKATFTEPEVL